MQKKDKDRKNRLVSLIEYKLENGYLSVWHNVKSLRESIQSTAWLWSRGNYQIIKRDDPTDKYYGKYHIARDYYVPMEIYNAVEKRELYLEYANLNLKNNKEINRVVSNWGVLGISGWNYKLENMMEIFSRRRDLSKVKENEKFLKVSVPITDYIKKFHPEEIEDTDEIENAESVLEIIKSKVPSHEPLSDFKREVKILSNLVNLYHAIQRKKDEDIVNCISYLEPCLDSISTEDIIYKKNPPLFSKIQIPEKDEKPKLYEDYRDINYRNATSPEDLIKIGKRALDIILSSAFEDINIKFKNNKMSLQNIGIPSLLPTLYYRLALDIAVGREIRKCVLDSCRKFFYPTRPDKLFCKINCKNIAKQRRLIQKKKLLSD